MIDIDSRSASILRAAAEWRDKYSRVRDEARKALRGGPWSEIVVDDAFDDLLRALDRSLLDACLREAGEATHVVDERPVLVILPGNIVGPAIACAFCAALSGSRAILKSASTERALAEIVARQFDRLGAPLAGTIEARYWKGGDEAIEAPLFDAVSGIIAFGSDAAIEDIKKRARTIPGRYYPDSHSIGFVAAGAGFVRAALGAARDVCMFDQSGCMSPQTIYVEGDESRALLFARHLYEELVRSSSCFPQVGPSAEEDAAIAARLRELAITVIPPKTHGLDTLMVGSAIGRRERAFVVAVEPFGPPTIHGFGRIVSVKPASDAGALERALAQHSGLLDTVGVAGDVEAMLPFLETRFSRICALGDMQRPPFGYRPAIADFLDVRRRARA